MSRIEFPLGMFVKNYYCPKCGEKLGRKKIKRTYITKIIDTSHYQTFRPNTIAKPYYDEYSHQFECPSCGATYLYPEQCVNAEIQKKCGSKILSKSQIDENYTSCRTKHNRRVLAFESIVPSLLAIAMMALMYIYFAEKSQTNLIVIIAVTVVLVGINIYGAILKCKRNSKFIQPATFTPEHADHMIKLSEYCVNNKELIEKSSKCYCFNRKCDFESDEIESYGKDGVSAVCPICDNITILPDSIDEPITDELLNSMENYWYDHHTNH